jgi:hypothetical protein
MVFLQCWCLSVGDIKVTNSLKNNTFIVVGKRWCSSWYSSLLLKSCERIRCVRFCDFYLCHLCFNRTLWYFCYSFWGGGAFLEVRVNNWISFLFHVFVYIATPSRVWLWNILTSNFLWIYSLTHGAELFLRSRQLCSHSRTSHHFMEPEGSLPYSQEPSTSPYPEPDRTSPYHVILSL